MPDHYLRRDDAKCAACERPVIFFERIRALPEEISGGGVILDPEPTGDGDTMIGDDGWPYSVNKADRAHVRERFPLYRSHFYTCPEHLQVPEAGGNG